MKSWEGKIALVTGASRGIGKAIALRLAEDGIGVAVHYGVNRTAAEQVVETIVQRGGWAFAVGADLEKIDDVNRLSNTFKESLIKVNGNGQFDILINNAGIGSSGPIEETTEEEFDRLFAVNVKAPFFLVKQLMPQLRDGGRIINVSSGVTRIAFPHMMTYNLTKGALNTFTLHLAKLLGPRNITVNAVLPGIVDTDNTAPMLHTEEGRRFAEESSALGRVGQPADIADAVAFLVSDDARWVTAELLDATGGSHL